MIRKSIKVDNLKCRGCANSVRQALLKIEGMKSVEVDLEKEEVRFEAETNVEENVMARLNVLGYPPAGTGNSFQKIKSYASCAIGRLNN